MQHCSLVRPQIVKWNLLPCTRYICCNPPAGPVQMSDGSACNQLYMTGAQQRRRSLRLAGIATKMQAARTASAHADALTGGPAKRTRRQTSQRVASTAAASAASPRSIWKGSRHAALGAAASATATAANWSQQITAAAMLAEEAEGVDEEVGVMQPPRKRAASGGLLRLGQCAATSAPQAVKRQVACQRIYVLSCQT